MWRNININSQNIKTETVSAVLIKMPHNSDYDGYSFWHPSKCVRGGRHSGAISIGYTESWNFRLVKYGKGKYNKLEIVDELEITVEDFEEAFGIMDENIKSPKEDDKSYLIVDEPSKIKDTEISVKEEFKNY